MKRKSLNKKEESRMTLSSLFIHPLLLLTNLPIEIVDLIVQEYLAIYIFRCSYGSGLEQVIVNSRKPVWHTFYQPAVENFAVIQNNVVIVQINDAKGFQTIEENNTKVVKVGINLEYHCFHYVPSSINIWNVSRFVEMSSRGIKSRIHGSCLYNNNKVFLFGGMDIGTNKAFRECECFDVAKGKWITIVDIPTPRSSSQCIVLEEENIAVMGGFSTLLNHDFDVVEIYNIKTNTWRSCDWKLPRPMRYPNFYVVSIPNLIINEYPHLWFQYEKKWIYFTI